MFRFIFGTVTEIKKAPRYLGALYLIRRRPTLPHRNNAVPSALEGLTSVFGMGTGGTPPLGSPEDLVCSLQSLVCSTDDFNLVLQSDDSGNFCLESAFFFGFSYRLSTADCRLIISSRANFMVKPLDRLVLVSFMCYHTSTPSLSTWWSSRGLPPPKGRDI